MVKFCPECGAKLEQEYKFCPECGYELSKTDYNKQQTELSGSSNEQTAGSADVIVCENCGEENPASNFNCSSCGIKLREKSDSDSAKEESKSTNHQQHPHKRNQQQVKKKAASNAARPVKIAPPQKKLNTVKLITIIAVALGIGLVLLIFSGTLNSLIVPGTKEDVAQQSSAPGVDMSNFQKINDMENELKNNPRDTAAILQLAHLKNDSGLYQQAIENYKQYLALVPQDPDARIDMGICYYNLGNYDTAIKEMEGALKYDPKHQIGYLDLGIVNLAAGNMEKSKENLKKAVQLDPNSEYGKKAEELLTSHNTTKTNGGN